MQLRRRAGGDRPALVVGHRRCRRRLDDPDDWVCREIAECLARDGVPVFPLLVDGAQMPAPADLPETIRSLARRQAYPIVTRHWAKDRGALVDILRRLPALHGPSGTPAGVPPTGTGDGRVSVSASPSSTGDGGVNKPRVAPWALLGGVATVIAIGLVIVNINSDRGQPGPSGPVASEPAKPNQGPVATPTPPSGVGETSGTGEPSPTPNAVGPDRSAPVAAKPFRAGDSFRDCNDCPEMVVVPAGEFMMGSPEGEQGRAGDQGPQHRVRISEPFAVGKVEVTFDQWEVCVAGGGCSQKPDDRGWGRGSRPAINVSWNDVQAYLKWLSRKSGQRYRLLSEAEWEFATRAGSTTRYPWGDGPGRDNANFYQSGSRWSGKQTAPVGQFDANRFGLHDVIGNVWEWVDDCWHDSYQGAPADGSAWTSTSCDGRVVRGGSWGSIPDYARSAGRLGYGPRNRGEDIGFRLARTL